MRVKEKLYLKKEKHRETWAEERGALGGGHGGWTRGKRIGKRMRGVRENDHKRKS